ncbi:MAG: flagellar hook-basal body complex protein FliE [Treponema sp.]|jgi:flagellar hook-basal body complex protein FliE|nr:flagellar hook-basal body complex protein FliE [Treponema sp.]
MTVPRPELIAVHYTLPMTVTNPKHIQAATPVTGKDIVELGQKIGTGAVTRSGTFEEAMLRALDNVSTDQQKAETLIQAAITDPDSVDVHDITIAQAKASLSLNISRTVLNRLVQGWKDIINTR